MSAYHGMICKHQLIAITAKVLHFSRVAAIAEELLIYDLGPRTRALQARAVVKRQLLDECGLELLIVPPSRLLNPCRPSVNPLFTLDRYFEAADPEQMLKKHAPGHATRLFACVECKRVSNAVADDSGAKWKSNFNELGTSGSIMSTDPTTGECALR